MKFFETLSPNKSALILGFFDGMHIGHKSVIKSAVENAKKNNVKSVLVTFKESPSKYFGKFDGYIYPRENSYKLAEALGVDFIYEQDFSSLVEISAENYLKLLVEKFNPLSISTGFNHTFGKDRVGNPEFLISMQEKYRFEFFYSEPTKINDIPVSSTLIKNFIKLGQLTEANSCLGNNYFIESVVCEGAKLGRELGFPTANINYPADVVKLPYGVYKGEVLGKLAVINWGIKPTIGKNKESLEVHIPNFSEDLYGKKISVSFISKIRDELKFNSLEDLKKQIQKDVEVCLK